MFKSLTAMAAAAILTAGFAGTASATDPNAYRPGYKAVTCYETVYETVWETVCETIYVDVVKSVPYEKTITKYDHCGKPYCVTVTCYKDVTVQVPKKITKQVPKKIAKQVCVTKWVKC